MKEEVRRGLSAHPKTLPAALLYDALGSVLFEAITLLPEYEVARVDFGLLEAHAQEALSLVAEPVQLVELGPGHGRKARVVLREVLRRQAAASFVAVDVAAAALEGCRRALEDLPGVTVTGVEATFIEGLRRAPRRDGGRRLVLFLGSNLSNLDRRESASFLCDVRSTLQPGDALLLSADLDKAPARLLPAYDDALGVTAAFNKNVLVRLNRDFGADFDLEAFAHEVRWNAVERRVEMHLRARRGCMVRLTALELDISFDAGESLWTESSHRFSVDELRRWGEEAGLRIANSWVDAQWPLALVLFIAV